MRHGTRTLRAWAFRALAVMAALNPAARAQDRLKEMPGYERYEEIRKQARDLYSSGALRVEWKDGGKAFEYVIGKKRYRYDVAKREAEFIGEVKERKRRPRRPGQKEGENPRPYPTRGRQFIWSESPDKKWESRFQDHNVWLKSLEKSKKGEMTQVTTEGNAGKRIKLGSAAWVYGEELGQRTAMWWSPDSKKLAFYRFDESKVKDYYLTKDHTKIQNSLLTEAYPKPGAPNPVADIHVYDLETKKAVPVQVRDGKPFSDDVVGHYVYGVSWTKAGDELLFHRTNRWQNVLEICAADPKTGKARVVVREEWPESWTENSPTMKFLEDGKRFVFASHRTGWTNYYLYDLTGKLIAPLTKHECDCGSIVKIDEKAGHLYYTAPTGDNHMMTQLHRVGLDGKNDTRLTFPGLNHQVSIAPDGKHMVDVAQTHRQPPTTRLLDTEGNVLATVAESDLTKFETLGLRKVELFEFTAADGETKLHGVLHKPSRFDPTKKYPLIVSVYAGPATSRASERFSTPSSLTELGFLVASFDSRSVGGRGKEILDSIYQKLGTVEIDDQAAGVKHLAERSYVDGSRVGVYGGSYGGYASIMCLMRHPDVFHAACASSSVTDWRNYDSIYTERYMRTPQVNEEGYDAGSAMKYIDKLKGRLMIYFGTADDNVHPAHSLQLIAALQKAGKSFDVQVGPDGGHGGLSTGRMMEFFIDNLGGPTP